jgi:hypothetical protein
VDVKIVSVEAGRIVFEVPAQLSVGPAILRLRVGTLAIQPIVVAIDPPPPVVSGVHVYTDFAVGPNWPAIPGEDLWVTVAGLADPEALANPERVRITLGGVVHTASTVTQSETDPNISFVRFEVSSSVTAGASVPLTVAVGDRVSQPVAIPVRAVNK